MGAGGVFVLKRGETVRLQAYGDREIARRFVAATEVTVYVCTDSEYKAAAREGREPRCVGFSIDYVIGGAG